MNHVTPKPPSRKLQLSDIGFAIVFIAILVSFVLNFRRQQKISSANDQLKTQLTKLRQYDRILTEQKRQAENDEGVIQRVFQQCREVTDLPDLQGKRIVSTVLDGDSVVFYMPGGKHRIHINTSWESSPVAKDDNAEAGDNPTAESDPENTLKGNQEWQYVLNEHSGYQFTLSQSDRKAAPIGWKLVSNAKDFRPLNETLPLPAVRTSGTSWSSFRVLEVPNRIELRTIIAKSPSVSDNQTAQIGTEQIGTVQIGRWTKSAIHNGQHLKIYFDLHLSSEGPLAITAEDAETMALLRRSEMIGDYVGEGVYLVNESEKKADR